MCVCVYVHYTCVSLLDCIYIYVNVCMSACLCVRVRVGARVGARVGLRVHACSDI